MPQPASLPLLLSQAPSLVPVDLTGPSGQTHTAFTLQLQHGINNLAMPASADLESLELGELLGTQDSISSQPAAWHSSCFLTFMSLALECYFSVILGDQLHSDDVLGSHYFFHESWKLDAQSGSLKVS